MNYPEMPLVWVQPILAELVAEQLANEVVFVGCEGELSRDELTDDDGYGVVLSFLINLRLPAAIPLIPDDAALLRWRADYCRVRTPISILGLAALDALEELRSNVLAEDDGTPVIAVDHPGAMMMDTLMSGSSALVEQLTGWQGSRATS